MTIDVFKQPEPTALACGCTQNMGSACHRYATCAHRDKPANPDKHPSHQPEPIPRLTLLPLGKEAQTFTREQMTILYRCSHGELGRLLVRRMAPLPIRVDGAILWFVDEARNAHAQVQRTLERWRHK